MVDQQRLQRYADVIIKVGVSLEPGQRLTIRASLGSAGLVRALVRQAYDAGAVNVDVLWNDPEVTRARFTNGPAAAREELPYEVDALSESARRDTGLVWITDDDPELLSDIDPAHVAQHQKHVDVALRGFHERLMRGDFAWTIAAAPGLAWARRVYPELDDDAAVEQLWEAILATCRVSEPDPIAAWDAHLDALDRRRQYLDGRRFDRLHYVGPGTDLVLGLPLGHLWLGGREDGRVANLPTEEVYTAPHRMRADGVVRATKPLSWFGTMIEGFNLRFEDGAVIEAHAERGQAALDHILATDEGSRRLGEVALVPQSSLVARQGLVWRNTLFDENDACHVALGVGYSTSIPDGASMSVEERVAAGVNHSDTHVDFVVGSPELDILGVTADGNEEPLLIKGEWAFDV